MKSYNEYLSEVEFKEINLVELNEDELISQECKQGVVIVDKGRIHLSLMRKFEPMQILNTVQIFEKAYEFIVVDPFGITIFSGTVDEVIEYAVGFYSEEDICSI